LRRNPAGDRLAYHSRFLGIVPEHRIVCPHWFEYDEERRLASLVRVKLRASGTGTAVRHAGQYAFLAVAGSGDDDVAHLKDNTRLQLNTLLAALSTQGTVIETG
jgi:hypothetical protein